MTAATDLIRRQLAGYSLSYIRSEAQRRIDRLREDRDPHAASAEAHIAGHGPTDEHVKGSLCVKCGEEWPCTAITVPWGLVDYA